MGSYIYTGPEEKHLKILNIFFIKVTILTFNHFFY